jgi:hypothetical protein
MGIRAKKHRHSPSLPSSCFGGQRLSSLRKNSKICHSEPRSVFERVRNLLFPWLSCEQQIPHLQTTRVRDDRRAFFRSLLEH